MSKAANDNIEPTHYYVVDDCGAFMGHVYAHSDKEAWDEANRYYSDVYDVVEG